VRRALNQALAYSRGVTDQKIREEMIREAKAILKEMQKFDPEKHKGLTSDESVKEWCQGPNEFPTAGAAVIPHFCRVGS